MVGTTLLKIYRHSPKLARELYQSVKWQAVPFPQVMGKGFAKLYNEVMESQWYSKAQLEEIRVKKLERTIKHAYENVPYWKQLFDERGLKPKDIQTPDDLRKIPVLTREQVQNNFSRLVAINKDEFKPWLFGSGGSTGAPVHFYHDRFTDLAEAAFVWRFRNWAGYGPKDKWVIMRYKRDFPPVKTEEAPSVRRRNILFLAAFQAKEDNLHSYWSKLHDFQPKSIYAFPHTLYVMARYAKEKGIPPISSLKSLTTSSETLFPHFRKLIEETFGAKIYDWYGSNEDVISAGECPSGSLHINSEYGILEVVDPSGNPVPPGKPGIVLGTTLHKFAMPFIRYRLGDRAILSDKPCPCGRGLPVIASFEGRFDDIIMTKDGRYVGRIDEAFHDSIGIKMSQIIQEEKGEITVRIVKGTTFSEEDIKKLDILLRKYLGEDMGIEYKVVENIELVGRGKYRFVISKLDVAKLYE